MNSVWPVLGLVAALAAWGGVLLIFLAPAFSRTARVLSHRACQRPVRSSLALLFASVFVLYGGGKNSDSDPTGEEEAMNYFVRFESGADFGEMPVQEFFLDVGQALASNAFTRTGYAFAHWHATNGLDYADGAWVTNLATVAGVTNVLTAQWQANAYTLRLDWNCAEGGTTNVACRYDEAVSLPKDAPVRTDADYAFEGWSASAESASAEYAPGAVVSNLTAQADATNALYAVWKKTDADYWGEIVFPEFRSEELTYAYLDAHDGKREITFIAGESVTNHFAIIAESGDATKTLVATLYADSDFPGQSTCAVTNGCEEARVAFEKGRKYRIVIENDYLEGALTYELRVGCAYVDVYFDPCGGILAMANRKRTYMVGKPYGELATTSWDGRTLTGWFTAQTNGVEMTAASNAFASVTNLYAQWDLIPTYTIAYNANGGTGTMTNETVLADQETTIAANAFTRTGYAFEAWAVTNGETRTYAEGQLVTNLAARGETAELLAQWQANAYTLRLDWNCAEGGTTNVACRYDEAVSLPSLTPDAADTMNAGYAFEGWATTARALTAQYAPDAVVSNLTDRAGETNALYAVWLGKPYTVHFDPGTNAVAGSMSDQAMYYGQRYTLNRNRYVRFGYVFSGWSDKANAKKAIWQDGASVCNLTTNEAEYTCHAVWTQDKTILCKTVDGNVATNDFGELKFSQDKPLEAAGTLTNHSDILTFTASKDGTFRVALDPLSGARINASATITCLSAENVSPTAVGGEETTVSSTNVTDVSMREVTFAFEKGLSYRVEISKNNEYDTTTPYCYVFSIGRTGQTMACDTYGGTVSGTNYGTNFNFSVGSPVGYLPTVTKGSAEFRGWYTAENGGRKIGAEDLVPDMDGVALTLVPWYYTGPYQYTVTYNKNASNAKGTMRADTFASDATNALQECSYTWQYHTFAGWATTAAGSVAFADGETFTEPLTIVTNGTVALYGVWEDNSPTYTNEIDGVTWLFTVDGNTATIVDNSGSDGPAVSPYYQGALVIPSVVTNPVTTNAARVVALGAYAFSGCAQVTSVTIPETVSNIAEYAFLNCVGLKSVTFKHDHALREIPAYCFKGCSALTDITLPYSITAVGDRAFADCTALTPGITIPEHVTTLGEAVFTNCTNLKIVRYWGATPGDIDENYYAGTPTALKSGVVKNMWTVDDETNVLDETWLDHPLAYLADPPALWRLTFDNNDVSGTTNTAFHIANHALVELPDDPERTGTDEDEEEGDYTLAYAFEGWYTDETAGDRVDADWVVVQKGPSRLYAHWVAEVESLKSPEDVELYYGENFEDTPPDMQRSSTYRAVTRTSSDEEDLFSGTAVFSVAVGSNSVGKVALGYTQSAVTADVNQNGLAKTFTGTMVNGLPVTLVNKADAADTMLVQFTSNGVAATWGDYVLQGARDGVATKGDWMQDAYRDRYLNKVKKWSVKMTNEVTGIGSELTLTPGDNGIMTLAGTVEGNKVSTTAKTILGEEYSYVPIQYALSGEKGTLMWLIRLDGTDGDADITLSTDTTPYYVTQKGASQKLVVYASSDDGDGQSGERYASEELGTLSFVTSAITVSEKNTYADITVQRTGKKSGAVYLGFKTDVLGDDEDEGDPSYARPYEEFYPTNGFVQWNNNETGKKTIRVRLVPDLYPTWEVDQRFAVTVQPLSSADIEDNEGKVVGDNNDWHLSEDSNPQYLPVWSGATQCVVTVTEADKKQPGTLSVTQYQTGDTEEAAAVSNAKKPAITVTAGESVTLTWARTGGTDGSVGVAITDASGLVSIEDDVKWDDGDDVDQTLDLSTVAFGDDDYTPTKTVTLKVSVLTGLVDEGDDTAEKYAKPALATTAVTLTLVNDKMPLTLESYAKTLTKADGIAIKSSKAGQWYFDTGDGDESEGDDEITAMTLTGTPLAAGTSRTLTYTLTGPGLFKLTPPSPEGETTCTVAWGRETYTLTSEDAVREIAKVLPAGSTTVKVTVQAGKNSGGDWEPEVTWLWLPFGTISPTPADKSVTTTNVTLAVSFDNQEAALEEGLTYRYRIGTGKNKLTDEYDATASIAITPGTHYWCVDLGYPGDDDETTYVTMKNVWSFTALAGDPKETTLSDAEESEVDSSEDIPLVQGVKAAYQLGSSWESANVTYKVVSGTLPTGLKLDAKTGAVSGVPTKAGVFTPVFQALNGKQGATTVAVTFNVSSLGLGAGTFQGVCTLDNATDDADTASVASVTFTASSVGKLSAKVLCGGKTYSFSGNGFDGADEETHDDDDETAVVSRTLTATLTQTAKQGKTTVTNQLAVTVYDGALTDTAVASAPGSFTFTRNVETDDEIAYDGTDALLRNNAKVTGWKDAVAPYAGYYTVALVPSADGDAEVGNGYMTLTVAASGSVKYAGVLADGTSYSGTVTGNLLGWGEDSSEDPSLTLLPYVSKSNFVLGGKLALIVPETTDDDEESHPYVSSSGDSSLSWVRTAMKTLSALSTALTPVGGWFDTVVNLERWYIDGNYDSDNGELASLKTEAASEGLEAVAGHYGKTLQTDEDGNALRNVTFKLKRATGVSTGTFDLYDGDTSKKFATLKHQGILILTRDEDNASEDYPGILSFGFYTGPTTEDDKTTTGSWSFNVGSE